MGPGAEEAGVGNIWVGLADWPPPPQLVPLHLTAQGGLTRQVAPAGSTVLTIDPEHPVPTYGGANASLFSGSADQRTVEARSDVLSFTSEPLERPLVVMGRVTARVWIVPDTLDLDLSVRLTDVYPDGRSLLVVDGIQRARMRCGDDVECLLEPGVPTEIEVDLWSTAMVFDAGHRIRVALAGTNFSRFEVNPCDGGDLNHGTPTVAHPAIQFGPDYPSAILLPSVTPDPRRPLGRLAATSP
jgi:putative CocE/NonD family hydrolase